MATLKLKKPLPAWRRIPAPILAIREARRMDRMRKRGARVWDHLNRNSPNRHTEDE